MIFTSSERRLIALLVLFLAVGFVLTAVRDCRAPQVSGEPNVVESDPGALPDDSAGVSAALPAVVPLVALGDGFLDVNAADSLALVALPGVGPALAGRILALRRERGSFRNLDELRGVKGIGPKRLEQLRHYLRAGAPRSATERRLSHGDSLR